MAERLQKLIAAAGLASRRQAETWIRSGRVRVNGDVAVLGARADLQHDDVRVDGQRLCRERLAYWILHKPRGVLTTTRDPHAGRGERQTVMDLLPEAARSFRLYPVGRLDVDSEGLVLLTNDGNATQALLHPSLGTEKEYRVTVRGRVGNETARRLRRGPLLEDGPMAPCQVGPRHFDRRRETTTFVLVLQEGRKRQIRRACAQLGHPVQRLLRTRMGPLRLGSLASGRARPLTLREQRALLAHARRRRPEAHGPHP